LLKTVLSERGSGSNAYVNVPRRPLLNLSVGESSRNCKGKISEKFSYGIIVEIRVRS
jgi:hypothetical protein